MPIGVEIKGTAGFLKRIHGRFLLLLMNMHGPFDPFVRDQPHRRYAGIDRERYPPVDKRQRYCRRVQDDRGLSL